MTLSVSREGTPDLAIRKNGRALRAVPPALRKAQDVAALRARKAALAQQATRVRAALEAAMIAQDTFTVSDFAALSRHPIVAPMLSQLIWADEHGRALGHTGTRTFTAAGENGRRRGATPHRSPHRPRRRRRLGPLGRSGSSPANGASRSSRSSASSTCNTSREQGRRQPRRYAGHQVQPRQALALLGRPRLGRLTPRRAVTRDFHTTNDSRQSSSSRRSSPPPKSRPAHPR